MVILGSGLLLWVAAHMFKRVMPGLRTELTERMGNASKGIFAGLILGSVALMVIGYRGADFVPVYDPPVWGGHLNNLLMLGAVVLFGMSSTSGRLRGRLRHPMLLGVATWAVAHLVANGDAASVLLFGGLLAWAVAQIALINVQDPEWVRPAPGTARGDVKLIVISLVVYGVIAAVHTWLGVRPFGG